MEILVLQLHTPHTRLVLKNDIIFYTLEIKKIPYTCIWKKEGMLKICNCIKDYILLASHTLLLPRAHWKFVCVCVYIFFPPLGLYMQTREKGGFGVVLVSLTRRFLLVICNQTIRGYCHLYAHKNFYANNNVTNTPVHPRPFY